MIEVFILSVQCFALSVIIHFFLLRIFSNQLFVIIAYLALGLGIISSNILFFSTFSWMNRIAACFLLIILWNLYTTFLINLMNSISVSIIVKIIESDNKELHLSDLVESGTAKNQLESRLLMAQKVKLLHVDSDTTSVLMLGRILDFFIRKLRKFWGISNFG